MGRAVSRDFLETPFFEIAISSYQNNGCLEVRKLQVFNTSNPLKNLFYGFKYITSVPYKTPKQNFNNLQKKFLECVKTGRNDSKFTIAKYHISTMEIIKGTLSCLRRLLATESSLKMMKNAFYFTLKALFVLKIFKSLS